MTTPDPRAEAFAALEDAIAKIAALDIEEGEIACDAVLLIGMQFVDSDGDRSGYVNIIPRHGWQPAYITAGLLAQAQTAVLRPPVSQNDDE